MKLTLEHVIFTHYCHIYSDSEKRTFRKQLLLLEMHIYPDGCSLDHWHCAMIWELLPYVATGNDGKQRTVNVAKPVRPLVPIHHVSVEPDLDCLPNLPGALVALSVQNLRLFPVDRVIIHSHVIRDRALVELSLRKFSFRQR